MDTKVRVCALQFERSDGYEKNVEKAKHYLEEADDPDFALIGGELSLDESINCDPYLLLAEMARRFNCNVVAPIDANRRRFPAVREENYYSMHVLNRDGAVVGIQNKQHFYWGEKRWFKPGSNVGVFEIDGIKIGLVRGLDIIYPRYAQFLKEVEILFFSTMAVDDIMLKLAKTRARENRCYIVMSSFMGKYVGMDFVGNAVVIEPAPGIARGMGVSEETNVLQHSGGEGLIQAELDIGYIREFKKGNIN